MTDLIHLPIVLPLKLFYEFKIKYRNRPGKTYLDIIHHSICNNSTLRKFKITFEDVINVFINLDLRYRIANKDNLIEIYDDFNNAVRDDTHFEIIRLRTLFVDISKSIKLRVGYFLNRIIDSDQDVTHWTYNVDKNMFVLSSRSHSYISWPESRPLINDEIMKKWFEHLPVLPIERIAFLHEIANEDHKEIHYHYLENYHFVEFVQRVNRYVEVRKVLRIIGQAYRNSKSTNLLKEIWIIIAKFINQSYKYSNLSTSYLINRYVFEKPK